MISGIEKWQKPGPPTPTFTGTPPCIFAFSAEPAGVTILTGEAFARCGPFAGSAAAWAVSAGMSGSWIVIGRLLVPSRSKCGASL